MITLHLDAPSPLLWQVCQLPKKSWLQASKGRGDALV